MAAEGPQVAFGKACEDQVLPRQQRRRDVRQQQVAEVVAVAGAEQDEGTGLGRKRKG